MYNIFVYGTLKKEGCNHHFLKDSEFVKNEVLKDHSIYVPDLFNFPLLLEDEGGKVHGEIYKIDDNTLANLDMLEGEGNLYNRINKDELDFQYYLFNDNGTWNIDRKKDKIDDGIWEV